MPFNICRQLGSLDDECSDAIFCKVALSGFVGGKDFGARARAGHDDEAGDWALGGRGGVYFVDD